MSNEKTITKKEALGVVIPLCLLAVLVASLVISVANDMYAFVKPDKQITVTLSGETSDKDFSKLLQQSGVIKNEGVFCLYLRSKGKSDDLSLLTGEWTLNSNMSYREILLEIF